MSESTADKKLRTEDKDRISNLPESVICHILSRLTTKEAVRTCVLSRSWEHKWTFIYNINIYDHEFFNYRRSTKMFFQLKTTKANFFNFVERVLLVSHNAKKFSLHLVEKYDSSRVTSWISTILRRKVENLEVIYGYESVILPERLLKCTSLRSLKLKSPCPLKVPIKSSLPRLTVLCLDQVKIQNDDPQAETLTFTFPMLKTFELRECTWLGVKFVDIHAPKLTTLYLKSSSLNAGANEYSIKIIAERVTEFSSFGVVPENVTVTGSLTYATMEHVFDTSDLQLLKKTGSLVQKLWKGLFSIKHLVLSGCLAKAMGHSERELHLPAIHNLQRLVLSSPANTKALITLLTAALNLKYVEADVHNLDDYDYGQVKPHSLLFSLGEVKLKYFRGTTSQLNLAKFLLRNGPRLKKVCLSSCTYNGCEKDKIAEELSTVPKRSPYLIVIVTY